MNFWSRAWKPSLSRNIPIRNFHISFKMQGDYNVRLSRGRRICDKIDAVAGSRSGIEHAAEQLLHRRRNSQVWKRNEQECHS